MKINLADILVLQKELDKNIEDKHKNNLDNILNKKKLALIVELCEMTNVNRCFKFWSLKKDYDKKELGHEFVDCLHFILSLSLHYKIDKYEYEWNEINYNNSDLTNQTLSLIDLAMKINGKEDCQKFIQSLFELSSSLGLTSDDILNFYKEKNEININRQKGDY